MKLQRSTIAGMLIGAGIALVIGGVCLYFEMTNQEGPPGPVSHLIIFLGAGSIETLDFILTPLRVDALRLPKLPLWIFLFFYWTVVGGVIGWLMGCPSVIRRASTLLLVVALTMWHWQAKQKFERDVEGAIQEAVTSLAIQWAPIFRAVGQQYLKEHPKE